MKIEVSPESALRFRLGDRIEFATWKPPLSLLFRRPLAWVRAWWRWIFKLRRATSCRVVGVERTGHHSAVVYLFSVDDDVRI